MPKLETFDKQPGETKDFDVSFARYLKSRGDTARAISPVETSVPAGITLLTAVWVAETGSVKLWMSGGTDKVNYPVTVWLNTAGGRRLEADVVFRIKD